MSIIIVGLGLWRKSLTVEAIDVLLNAKSVLLRTENCEAAEWLRKNGVSYTSFDDMYDRFDDFTELYDAMANRICGLANDGDVVYGVIYLRDESVMRLAGQKDVRLIPGPSIDGELFGFACSATSCVAACDISQFIPEASRNTIVREIDSRLIAGEVKLCLTGKYPFDTPVVALNRGAISKLALGEIDRLDSYDHTTCVFVPSENDWSRLETFGFMEMCGIAKTLPIKPVSLANLKSALSDAQIVGDDDDEGILDVLGSALCEVGLICESARRRGRFSVDDVVTRACEKLLNARSGRM